MLALRILLLWLFGLLLDDDWLERWCLRCWWRWSERVEEDAVSVSPGEFLVVMELPLPTPTPPRRAMLRPPGWCCRWLPLPSPSSPGAPAGPGGRYMGFLRRDWGGWCIGRSKGVSGLVLISIDSAADEWCEEEWTPNPEPVLITPRRLTPRLSSCSRVILGWFLSSHQIRELLLWAWRWNERREGKLCVCVCAWWSKCQCLFLSCRVKWVSLFFR